jgi:hypothetical protein
MKFRVWMLLVMIAFFLPLLANAATCSALIPTASDGRTGSSLGYLVNPGDAKAVFSWILQGHSYSVDVWAPTDPVGGLPTAAIFFNFNASGTDCLLKDSSGITDTASFDPKEPGGRRASFIAPTTEFIYAVIENTDVANVSIHNYQVRVTDTTLFNPRWSTYSGYVTSYSFLNNSSHTIHGTLTINVTFGGSGTITYSLNGDAGIAPGTQLVVTLGPGFTIDVPSQRAGTAMLAHDGPPGALTVDAYFSNSTSIVPAVFAPRDFQH